MVGADGLSFKSSNTAFAHGGFIECVGMNAMGRAATIDHTPLTTRGWRLTREIMDFVYGLYISSFLYPYINDI